MKRIYLLIIALLAISVGTWAQTKTWVGSASGGSWATNGNWSPSGAPSTGDIVVFDNGVSGTITAVPSANLAGLRVENGSNVTLSITANRTINVTATGSTQRFIVDATSNLTLNANGSTLTFGFSRSGGTGNTTARIDGTFRFGNGSNVSLGTNNNTLVTVNGRVENAGGTLTGHDTRLVFASGSTYSHERNGGSIVTANWNAASTCEVRGVTGTVPDVASFGQSFGNFTWNSPSQNTLISLISNLETINGDFTVANTGSGQLALKISGGTATTTVAGDFNLTGGFLYIVESSGGQNLSVRGNVNLTGGTLSRGGSGVGTFIFSGTGVQTYTRTSTTIGSSVNFTVSSGAQVDFGTSTVTSSGIFTLSGGGKLITSHPDGLRSSGSFGSIQTNTRSYSGNANYEFRGASTGNFSTTSGGGNDVSDLIINNTSGQVAMGKSFTVNGALTLTNGYLTTGANTLLVTTGGTSTSANNAYVNGVIQKQINTTNSAFTFFVGDAATVGLRPIRFTSASGGGAGSGTSTFAADFIRGNANDEISNTLGSGIARVSSCEYWTLSRTGGSRNGTVNISWGANSDCSPTDAYITNVLTLRVARFDGASWVNAGNGLVGGSTTVSGSITSTSQTAFTTFALASSNQADNPLPVLFDGVKAYAKNEGVQLEWSNLTERDIIRYEVERSANGIDFYPINQQAPKSNRDDKASYTHFDASPINGANFYRIRVDEIGGKPVYSKILRVERGSTKVGFSIYPNPVVGKQLTVTLSNLSQGQFSLQVYNTSGQRVYTTNINNVGSGVTQMIELPASLKSGVYVTVISGDSYRESKQFILK